MEPGELESLPTEEKILIGASSALAQYGLSKLSMNDVSRAAGISKATLYRYFATKADVLNALSLWEERRFSQKLLHDLEQAEPDKRFDILVAHSVALPANHPVFMRFLDSDPAFVLSALRRMYPTVKDHLSKILAGMFENNLRANEEDITVEQLTNCFVRILLTTYLFPDEQNDGTGEALKALFKKVCK